MASNEQETILTLAREAVPPELAALLRELAQPATLASLELLADGRLVVQVVPGVDPQFVARIRLILAQYEDVLRRLT